MTLEKSFKNNKQKFKPRPKKIIKKIVLSVRAFKTKAIKSYQISAYLFKINFYLRNTNPYHFPISTRYNFITSIPALETYLARLLGDIQNRNINRPFLIVRYRH